jgi:multiple sugar transport system permease protein/putative aldouronate transport system permease protein
VVRKRRIKQSFADIAFDALVYILMVSAFVIVVYPLLYIVSCSFSDRMAVTGGQVWLFPVKPTLFAYDVVFKYNKVWTGYMNSITYMVLGTVAGVSVTILAAYPLARNGFVGKKLFSWLFLFTMLFSGGLVPTYLWIKNMNMLDSIWVMVLPGACSAWNIIIMRTYFQTSIPTELFEAAELDGCSDLGMLFRIVLPLSGAVIAVISLFFAVWLWNSYFSALIYLTTESKFPLPIILRDILIMNDNNSSMFLDIDNMIKKQGIADVLRYVLIVVASAPLLIIYPFVQKYFIKGVMLGSIKG